MADLAVVDLVVGLDSVRHGRVVAVDSAEAECRVGTGTLGLRGRDSVRHGRVADSVVAFHGRAVTASSVATPVAASDSVHRG